MVLLVAKHVSIFVVSGFNKVHKSVVKRNKIQVNLRTSPKESSQDIM